MAEISTSTLTLLVLMSLGMSAIAAVYAYTVAAKGTPKAAGPVEFTEDLQSVLEGHARHILLVENAVRKLAAESKKQGESVKGAVQHVGMVRYDAFEDVGGRLSFSCALLDDRGDGVVITSINGRQDTRVYAKPVSGAKSSHNLSEEEVAAIYHAVQDVTPEEPEDAG